jgi:hypothetical protein
MTRPLREKQPETAGFVRTRLRVGCVLAPRDRVVWVRSTVRFQNRHVLSSAAINWSGYYISMVP